MRGWKVSAMALVAAIVVAGASYAGVRLTRGEVVAVARDPATVAVSRGNVQQTVVAPGMSVGTREVALGLGAGGRLAAVNVRPGSVVSAGDVLARLDDESIAALEHAVSQARALVAEAERSLTDLVEPTSLRVAQGGADVSAAAVMLADAQDSLEELLQPAAKDIAELDLAVANARTLLVEAEKALAELTEPKAVTVAQAEEAVANARLQVDGAGEAVDDATDWRDDRSISEAESRIGFAATAIENARRSLSLLRADWVERESAATEALELAVDAHQRTFEKWFGTRLTSAELKLDPESLMDAWGVDLGVLFDRRTSSNALLRSLDDPDTRWNDLTVWAWLNLYADPTEIVGQCDGGAFNQTRCVSEEIEDTWRVLRAARHDLDTVLTRSVSEVAAVLDDVARAEEAHAAAEEALAELVDGPHALEIEAREKTLELARAELAEAEDDLAKLVNGANAVELEAKAKQASLAHARLDQAERDLAEVVDGPDPVELEAARDRLVVARAALDQATKNLRAMTAGGDPRDLTDRETTLASARASLDAALRRLAASTLTAPFDGVVLEVTARPGEMVPAGVPFIILADPVAIEVRTTVIEEDLPLVQVGQIAEIFFDARPEAEVSGAVARIVPQRVPGRDRPLYHVYISVDDVPDGVFSGMTADASIVVDEESDVLRLPRAIVRGPSGGTARLKVWADGREDERTVRIGLKGDVNVQIVEGLDEGDRVVAR